MNKVLKEIEKTGYSMIVGPVKGEVLAKEVKKKNPKRILEVGTFVGYSAILMADTMNDSKTKIITLEVEPRNARVAKENISRAGFEDIIEVKIGDAKELIPELSGKFDFMFIDAVKEDYLDYLKLAEEKLEKDAVVVADNVKIFESDLGDYIEYVRESGKYESKTTDVGFDAMEVSVKTG